METRVIRLTQATGPQLQEAARAANLTEVPNEIYGFYTAIFASSPSPMQLQVLRKGMQAAGYNYLQLTECARVATEVDRMPSVLTDAVRNMAKFMESQATSECKVLDPQVAGKVVYQDVQFTNPISAETNAKQFVRMVPKAKFVATIDGRTKTWSKGTKVGRRWCVAVVEVIGSVVRFSSFQGG